MALLNNVIEFPSDAFKIVTHFRHPLPKRADTIGPWLDCLSFLAWLSALTNSALVYLFRPHHAAAAASLSATAGTADVPGSMEFERARMREVLARALFIALAASHGYIVLRTIVRHVLERAMWYGSPEKARLDAAGREVKERYLQSVGGAPTVGARAEEAATAPSGGLTPPLMPLPASEPALPPPGEFWQFDEGLDEIRKGVKEA